MCLRIKHMLQQHSTLKPHTMVIVYQTLGCLVQISRFFRRSDLIWLYFTKTKTVSAESYAELDLSLPRSTVSLSLSYYHCVCLSLCRIGTAGIAVQVVGSNWPKPHYTLLITGLCRFRVSNLLKERPFVLAEVKPISFCLWSVPLRWECLDFLSLLSQSWPLCKSRSPLVVKLVILMEVTAAFQVLHGITVPRQQCFTNI